MRLQRNAMEALGYAALSGFFGAIVGGATTVLGWFATNYLVRKREDRSKRLQINMEHRQKQLTEFYAPLRSLIVRLNAAGSVWEKMVAADINAWKDGDKIAFDEYFAPLHKEVLDILSTKIYLLEGTTIPPSIQQYFEHTVSEGIYWRIAEKTGCPPNAPAKPFPPNLYEEINRDFHKVLVDYESSLDELRAGLRKRVSSP
jgi:hypothetical protein